MSELLKAFQILYENFSNRIGNPMSAKVTMDAVIILINSKGIADGIQLMDVQLLNAVFFPFVQYFTDFMIRNRIREFCLFLNFFRCFIIVKTCKTRIIRKIHFLTDLVISDRWRFPAKCFNGLAFFIGKRTLCVLRLDTEMIDILQEGEALKRIAGFRCALFFWFQGAASYHLFNLITAIRASAARSLVKMPLRGKDFQIFLLKIF